VGGWRVTTFNRGPLDLSACPGLRLLRSPTVAISKHSLVSLITITDGIVTPGPFWIDDDWRYKPRRALPLFDPTKKLRKGIGLVIMATVRESK